MGDHPDVETCDQQEHSQAGVATSQPDVMQATAVAQGERAGAVDAVVADPEVGRDLEARTERTGLGALLEDCGGDPSAGAAVGTPGVVVVAEPVELGLELADGGGGLLVAEPLLLGLVETLDLATGLGMVGP